ncbi:HtaA domain-containing protein [Pseudoclavibacter endophyticus]|uniref:Htaa domain-containing protein n=1 Tax=Pseudoclavibacter endophyticus TaxID=1778590 RepID=A0A6H9WAT9_9MICO|nr:HtaA domain-containing protein [Pseudoclavibacter endophyticus]KAB1646864.1 hypothetical protein F8O04_14130 [Pseudoclavibacter endophyticus]
MDASTQDAAAEWRGELRWVVKASFAAYVRSSEGRIEVSGGAREDDGEYVFPRGVDGVQVDGELPRGIAKFTGAVRFIAHGGMLDVTIASPELVFQGDVQTLVAANGAGEPIVLATLDVGGPLERDDVLEWIGVTPTLTSAGSAAFNNVYPAQSDLDPLSFQLMR